MFTLAVKKRIGSIVQNIAISNLFIMIAGLTAAYHTRNIVVEWGIEEGSSEALGVETELYAAKNPPHHKGILYPFYRPFYSNNLSSPLT